MATEIATAYVSLIPSFRGGSRAISRSLSGPIGKAGPQAGRSLGRSILGGVTRAAAVGGGLAAALGVGRLARDVAASASGIQNTTATLTGLLGSASAATDTMTRLREVARNSPIDYQTYLSAGESLAYLGVSGEQAEGILTNVGAAITAAGGSSQQMESVSDALLTMVNTGRVYANDLNRISDAGVPIFSSLAEHFGTNIENVREMVTAGEVGIEDVMTAIENAEGDTFQSMLDASELAAKTFSNQWAIAKDNITTTLATQLTPVIERLTPLMQTFAERAPALIESGVAGMGAAFATLSGTIDGVRDRISEFMDSASGQDLKTDTLDRLSSIWDNLKLAWDAAWPAIQQIAGSLAEATAAVGISTWSILLATLDLLSAVLVDILVPALQGLATFMSENQALVTGLVGAYTAWRVAVVAATAVTVAKTAATSAAAAAQRLLNAAMRANPIGIIITALTALVAAIVYAWKNSETFRNVVTSVWDAIQSAVSWAWNNVIKPVLDWFVEQLQELWSVAVAVKDGLVAAWNGIYAGVSAAWGWLRDYVFTPIMNYYNWVWDLAVQVWGGVVAAFRGMYQGVLSAWGWLRDNVFNPVLQFFDWLWEKAVSVKDGVVGAFRAMYDGLVAAYGWMRDNVFLPVIGWFQDVWDKAVEIAAGIKDSFDGIKESISDAFSAIWEGIKAPINVVIGGINKYIIGGINAVTGVFGIDAIDDIPTLHTGGHVPGTGEHLYKLLGGEAVLNPAATQALGKDNVDRLNRGEAMGGPVDWLKDRWNDYWRVKGAVDQAVQDQVGDWLREGAAFALGKVIDTGRGALSAIPGESFAEEWMSGGLAHFKDQIVEWGRGKDAINDDSRSPKGSGPVSKEGWMFPLPPGSFRVGRGPGAHGYQAWDFPAPMGTLVRAPFAGVVQQTNLGNRSYGRYLRLRSGGREFLAAHLSGYGKSGTVVQGDTIGRVGSTGNSTGPHLHAETSLNGAKRDPAEFLKFDSGGMLPPGILNQTGRPEPVLTSGQWEAISALAGRGAAGGDTYNVYAPTTAPQDIISAAERARNRRYAVAGRLV